MSTLSLDLRGVEASHALPREAPAKSASLSLLLHGAGISSFVLISLLETTSLPAVTKAMTPPVVHPFTVILPATPVRVTRVNRRPGVRPSLALAAIPSTPKDTPTSLVMPSALDVDPMSSAGFPTDLNADDSIPGTCPPGSLCGNSTAALDPPPIPRVRIGGDIREPRLREGRAPVYPPMAQAAGVSGTVVLEALVGQDGRVKEVRIKESSTLFDEAALASVRSRRYDALLLNGVPTEFLVTVTVTFNVRR